MTISNVVGEAGSVSSASATSPARFASSLWAGKKYESRASRAVPAPRRRRLAVATASLDRRARRRAGADPGWASPPGSGRTRSRLPPSTPRRDELEPAGERRQLAVAVPDQVDGTRRRGTGRSPGRALRRSQSRRVRSSMIATSGPPAVHDRGIPEGCREAPPRDDDGVRLERREDLVGPLSGRPGRAVRSTLRDRARRARTVGARSTAPTTAQPDRPRTRGRSAPAPASARGRSPAPRPTSRPRPSRRGSPARSRR